MASGSLHWADAIRQVCPRGDDGFHANPTSAHPGNVTIEVNEGENGLSRRLERRYTALRSWLANLRAQLEAIGGLSLLGATDPTLKARFYEEIGLESVCDPREPAVEVHVLNGRVGGAYQTLSTLVVIRGELASASAA